MSAKTPHLPAPTDHCPLGLPHLLLGIYVLVFLLLGYAPHDRGVWIAENLPIVLIVLGLGVTFRKHRFSDTAYVLMAVLIFLHTLGAHYTFARVPFGLITDTLGFTRNHFDRLAHFSVGFYAFPAAELLLRRRLVRSRTILLLFSLFFIFFVAAGYEIVEWLFVLIMAPDAGTAFLGVQGDPWDAQKDMLADALGAVTALIVFWIMNYREIKNIPETEKTSNYSGGYSKKSEL
jgi:putative membrane protein